MVSVLSEKFESEVRARIVGCQSQMGSFSFFFCLLFSNGFYSLTNQKRYKKKRSVPRMVKDLQIQHSKSYRECEEATILTCFWSQ